ncbi:hypothetical protein BSY18_4134 (plasmid) [Blastomonas sp. RAC04]|nr:hypothetical protein BSY18_4134 [Blastomonas sp. RAC04]
MAMPVEPLRQGVGIARDNIASQHLTVDIDHADMRRLITHIQSCINRHLSSSRIEALLRLRTMHEGG